MLWRLVFRFWYGGSVLLLVWWCVLVKTWSLDTVSLGALLRLVLRLQTGVSWAVFSFRGSTGEEFNSKFIQIVGRIHILVARWMMASIFLCRSNQWRNEVIMELGGPLTQYDWCSYTKWRCGHKHAYRENAMWIWRSCEDASWECIYKPSKTTFCQQTTGS